MDKKQILILLKDNSSHTKNLDTIILARELKIALFSSLYNPSSSIFRQNDSKAFIETFAVLLRSHPTEVIKQVTISERLVAMYLPMMNLLFQL